MMRALEERAGLLFSIITTLVFCAASFGVAQSQISHNAEAIDKWENDRDILLRLEADVSWIRARMARDDRLGLGPRFGPQPGNNPSAGKP